MAGQVITRAITQWFSRPRHVEEEDRLMVAIMEVERAWKHVDSLLDYYTENDAERDFVIRTVQDKVLLDQQMVRRAPPPPGQPIYDFDDDPEVS